ncbi:hypothetical protein MTO96_008640 [Rhipicephalus appendiculatus]
MASSAGDSQCAGSAGAVSGFPRYSTLKLLSEVIRLRRGKNKARDCSSTEEVLPIPDDSEVCAYSKPLPAKWDQSTNTSQDARRGEYFRAEEQEEAEKPDAEEGAAPEASIEDFMQMELKEGPALKSPVRKRGRVRREKPLLCCNLCPFTTIYPRSLSDHEKSHTRKCLKCEQCHERFERQYQLRKHMWTHTGKKPFQCDRCSYSTFMKYFLERHHAVA